MRVTIRGLECWRALTTQPLVTSLKHGKTCRSVPLIRFIKKIVFII